MKDVTATLRRIDDEINANRQEIAARQVAIIRLEDARRVIMGMAEADQAAHAGRAGDDDILIPGSHAHPQLIVRATGTPAGAAKMVNGKRLKQPRGSPLGAGAMRPKILALLAEGPLTSREIGDRLGLASDMHTRKGMSNALYVLHRDDVLDRSTAASVRDRRYSLKEQSQ